jgi:rhodanese-related sulfurtransferase
MIITQATKEALVLLVLSAGIALAVFAFRADSIDTSRFGGRTQPAISTDGQETLSEISLQDAVRFYNEEKAVFADARHAADYDAGHIRGAVHLSVADQDIWLDAFLEATDPATMIVTYCDGDDCHLAPALSELLYLNGFRNVRYLKNGWTRWRQAGFPVE